jgi:hypothetical protein
LTIRKTGDDLVVVYRSEGFDVLIVQVTQKSGFLLGTEADGRAEAEGTHAVGFGKRSPVAFSVGR